MQLVPHPGGGVPQLLQLVFKGDKLPLGPFQPGPQVVDGLGLAGIGGLCPLGFGGALPVLLAGLFQCVLQALEFLHLLFVLAGQQVNALAGGLDGLVQGVLLLGHALHRAVVLVVLFGEDPKLVLQGTDF